MSHLPPTSPMTPRPLSAAPSPRLRFPAASTHTTSDRPMFVDGSMAKVWLSTSVEHLVHKTSVAVEENALLRREITGLQRLIDALNDRAHVADAALERVNEAFSSLGLSPQPTPREKLSDAWVDYRPEEDARKSLARENKAAWTIGEPTERPPSMATNRKPTQPPHPINWRDFRRVVVPSPMHPDALSLHEIMVSRTLDEAKAKALRCEELGSEEQPPATSGDDGRRDDGRCDDGAPSRRGPEVSVGEEGGGVERWAARPRVG